MTGSNLTDLWYTDEHTRNVRFSMKVTEQIASKKSKVQRIDILDTPAYGRVLCLDGGIMITERDEFIYHEMLAHVPMAVHPRVKNVLVIGGGDGGTVRELCKYKSIETIDLVEADKDVVLLSKKHLPFVSSKLKDKRVSVWFEEGLRFVRGKKNEYDLIIVDSPDPYGPAEGFFTREFYGTCYKALRDDGILINQHESPFYDEHCKSVRDAHRHITLEFPISTVYQAHIPSYPSGHWLFGFASKKWNPIGNLDEARWNKLRINTRYYNTALHRGAFALPNYVLDMLHEEEQAAFK